MTGTASIKAIPDGVELRQGQNTVRLYRHQIPPFADYAIDWFEQLEQRAEQEGE
ncbi:hypothetical protein [Pseudactinotalea sp.]|uniref:hypothetical protein n=1 Tax=Pseudactinotalea sp. TaxID=1926260 RepID=UPI003B3A7C03